MMTEALMEEAWSLKIEIEGREWKSSEGAGMREREN